mmetsp:Transcript_9379/g.10373  ORF Transcript_9379/g.10373 Transcript_9379/m.10373 type:complete len:257 (+) Transcript_9379:64-834(+)
MSFFKRIAQLIHYYFILIFVVSWFLFCSLLGALYCIFHWKDSNIPHDLGPYYSAVTFWVTNIKLQINDPEGYLDKSRPCIFLSNHQSLFDLATICRFVPEHTVCVAKQSLRYIPLFGLLFVGAGNIHISRTNTKAAIETMNNAIKRMNVDKDSVWLFPEGSRNYDSTIPKKKMTPFKKGSFHLAVQSQRPLVPVMVSPMERIFSYSDKIWYGGTITINVLPPIMPTGLSTKEDVNKLTLTTQEIMSKAYQEFYNEE